MANKFQIKRTTQTGRTPNTTNSSNGSYIAAGELAVNLSDSKLFTANTSNGLIELGSNLTNLSVTGNTSFKALYANGSPGEPGQILTSNSAGIYWSSIAAISTNVSATYTWTNNHIFIKSMQANGISISNNGALDASLHIVGSLGGYSRFIQISPGGPSVNTINLIASSNSSSGEQWWTWGVDINDNYRLNKGVGFGGAGLNVSNTGQVTANSFSGDGTYVSNVTAVSINGYTFISPPVIGSGTANSANFKDLTVSGNVTISGDVTYINSTDLRIGDRIVALNTNLPSNTAPTQDVGFEILRGSANAVFLNWNETNDEWTIGEQTFTAKTIKLADGTGVATVNNTVYTGTANNANYLGGNTASDLRTYSDQKSGNAYSNAVSVASTDATNKAGNAYSNAVSTAATDATNKAANAYSNAVSYTDAKAANAYSNAVSVAATDATNKAGNAYSNAVTFASNASNISSGTLDTARLPAVVNVATQINVNSNTNINSTSFAVGNLAHRAILTSNELTLTDIVSEASNTFITRVNHDTIQIDKEYLDGANTVLDSAYISREVIAVAEGVLESNTSNYKESFSANTTTVRVGNTSTFSLMTKTGFTGNGALLTSVNAASVGGNTASDLRTYTDQKSGNAYSNAVSVAATDATNKAGNAYSNAVSVAATDATNKASNAYSNAVTFASNATNISSGTLNSARLPTSGVVANTYGNSSQIPVFTVDATGRVTNATTASVSGVTSFTYTQANSTFTIGTGGGSFYANINYANSVQAGLIRVIDSVISTDVDVAASLNSVKTAYDSAIDANTRAASAQTAAELAYSNAYSFAATEANNKASNAYSNAVSDAVNHSSNATNLISGTVAIARLPVIDSVSNTSANLVAVANSVKTAYDAALAANLAAANAYSNAITYASNATNISSGTLDEIRLPYRMNQNVRSTDSVTFANGNFTASVSIAGDLTVTGNVTSTNVSSLAVADPLIKLGVGNAGDTYWGGFTFHYSGSGNTTNHAGLVRDPSTKEFVLMSTYGDEDNIANNNSINIADASFSYANLQVQLLKTGNSSVYSTLNATSFSGTSNNALLANNATNLGGVASSSYALLSNPAFTGNVTIGSSITFYGGTGAATVKELLAGNTYIIGYANVSGTIQGSSSLTIAGALSGVTTAAMGNTTITGFANISGSTQIFGSLTANSDVYLNTGSTLFLSPNTRISANGSYGQLGWVLHSNGVNGGVYWAADDQGVTSVTSANGLTGGTITSTGTISVRANTGIVANSTGLFVNAAYINTISSNNSTYLGGYTWESPGAIGSTTSNTGAFTTLAAGNTTITGFANVSSYAAVSSTLTVRGTSSEGGQLVLGFGNNLTTSISGQANNTFNLDVVDGDTSPSFRLFAIQNNGSATNIWAISNTGRIHFGSGNIQTDSTVKITGSANVTSTFSAGNTTITGFANIAGNIYSKNLLLQGDDTNAYIRPTNSGSALYLGANNQNHVYITAAGNFGIGGSPSGTLDVVRSAATAVVNITSGANTLQLFENMTGAASIINYASGGNITVSQAGAGFINFGTNGSERMRITDNGSVGIGNTSPTDKLSVNGTTYLQGVTTAAANVALANNYLIAPTLKAYSEDKTTNASATGTVTLDLSTTNVFELTLTGATTLAFSNPPPNTKVFTFTIVAKQDATGGRVITWPTSKKFAGGLAPPQTTTANAIDVWTVMTYDGGTSYIISLSVKDAK